MSLKYRCTSPKIACCKWLFIATLRARSCWRERWRKRRAEECGVRARQGERRNPERDDRNSFFRWSEQERKGPAEHRIDDDRIHREIAADVAYPGALMRYCIGKDVLQSEAELGWPRCDLAAFGKALVELPIIDVDFRAERDESRAGRLRPLPEQAPGMHDDLVAATDEVSGNGQQGARRDRVPRWRR